MSVVTGPGQRGITLTRVSTKAQETNTSHEVQEEAAARFNAQYQITPVVTLRETVSGALYLARHETQRALAMLEADEADVLILYDFFRYGRDVEFQQKILKRITRCGKRLQISTFPLEYDDATGELTPEYDSLFINFGGASQTERKLIRRRTQSGRLKKLSQGVQMARTFSPFGYYIVKNADVTRGHYNGTPLTPDQAGAYLIVPDQLQWIKPLFERAADGHSLRRLAAWLQEQGVPTPRGAKVWRWDTIYDMLRNPVYMGQPSYGRNQHLVDDDRVDQGLKSGYNRPRPEAQWQALSSNLKAPVAVEAALWQRVQATLDVARAKRSGRCDRRYLLSGLLRCPECGQRMRARTRAGGGKVKNGVTYGPYPWPHYFCEGRDNNFLRGLPNCQTRDYKAAALEAHVVAAVLAILDDPAVLTEAYREYLAVQKQALKLDNGGEQRRIQRELAALERREWAAAQSRIDATIAGQDTRVYDRALADLGARKAQLEARLGAHATLRAQVEQAANLDGFIAQRWGALRQALLNPAIAPVDKNRLLSNMIQQITPHGPGANDGITLYLIAQDGQEWQVTYRDGELAVTISANLV